MIREIITRSEAEKRGIRKYFTGKACARGHTCKRWASGGNCEECQILNVKRWQKNNRDKINANRRRLRKEGRLTLPPSERPYDIEKRKQRYKGYRQSINERYKKEQVIKAGRDRPHECEICGEAEVRICFDHCHETGLFRGWLCVRCNSTLGLVRDKVNILEKLIEYLKKFRGAHGHGNQVNN